MRHKSFMEKFELYILSLWLLFFLVIVVTLDPTIYYGEPKEFIGLPQIAKNNIAPLFALLFLLLGALYFFRFEYRISGSSSIPVAARSVDDMNYEHLTFLTTYIIPLVCIDLGNERYLLVLLILLVVIGVIYVKTDKFYANPSLSLLGFRLYRATVEKRTGEEVNVILITKSRLPATTSIRYIELDERVYYAREAQ